MSLAKLIPLVVLLLSGTALSVHGYLESRRPEEVKLEPREAAGGQPPRPAETRPDGPCSPRDCRRTVLAPRTRRTG